MNDLLERLERMGPPGGVIALALAALLVIATVALAWNATDGFTYFTALLSSPSADAPDGVLDAFWRRRGLAFSGALTLAAAVPAAMIGVRLLTQRHYPSASEVFPAMSLADVRAALENSTENQCVCTRCHIMVPAAYSTGSCPVCASSVEYHEIRDDEDAKIVLAAMD